MVNRPQLIYKVFPPGRSIEKVSEFGEVEVSNADTVTFYNLHASKTLLNLALWQKTDGTALTYTIVNNIITVTSAVTNAQCIYIVYGFKP